MAKPHHQPICAFINLTRQAPRRIELQEGRPT